MLIGKKTIGFVINPVAGMGGRVGLKGTDGKDILNEALKRGAKPQSGARALQAISQIDTSDGISFMTCGGDMGEDVLREAGIGNESMDVIYRGGGETSADDTRTVCQMFKQKGVDLLIFCGGDGTARDVWEAVGDSVPVIGIPAGVKMHSSVFGINPRVTGEIVNRYLKGELSIQQAEVMDIDEEAYRDGRLSAKLYGYMMVPVEPVLIQGRKFSFQAVDDDEAKAGIAEYVEEMLDPGSVVFLGAGSTVKAVGEILNIDKTILGVDAVFEGEQVGKDLDEKGILELLERHGKGQIVISVIGAQGFLFGRGNQQFSAEVIRKVDLDNVLVIATPYKMKETPVLHADTGDNELDKDLKGYRKVIIGYHQMRMTRVK